MKTSAPGPARRRLGAACGRLGAVALGLSAAAVAFAAGPAPMGCLIEPERVTDVGSPVVGVIERIEVERGQTVRRGQLLAVLRADVERANLGAASSRADSDADVKAAAVSADFNRERLARAEDLFRQRFVSQQALDQARAESQMADQKLAQAREQRQVSQHERSMAAAQVSQRVIRSPIDGVVAERWLTAGERVDDKPLMRIARVDPLRVQLVVPVALYGQVRRSGRVSVQPDLPGALPVSARVTMIDRVVDPASNTFRVQLELPNPDAALPAGLRCKAEFVAEAPADAAAPIRSTAPSVHPSVHPSPAAAPAPVGRGTPRASGLALALAMTLDAPAPPHRAPAPTAALAAPNRLAQAVAVPAPNRLAQAAAVPAPNRLAQAAAVPAPR